MGDGNESVSRSTSQSSEGTFCRGYWVATLSGPEKSRQSKQDCCAVPTLLGASLGLVSWLGFGFVANIFERSGLDDIGTGGGVRSKVLALDFSSRFAGRDGMVGPFSTRALTGGIVLGGSRLAYGGGDDTSDVGVRWGKGGREGNEGTLGDAPRRLRLCGNSGVCGGGIISRVVILLVDLAVFSGALGANPFVETFSSRPLLEGGRGGSAVGSYAGARTLDALSIEGVRGVKL